MAKKFGNPDANNAETLPSLLTLLSELVVEQCSPMEPTNGGRDKLSGVQEDIQQRVCLREGGPVTDWEVGIAAWDRYFRLIKDARESLQEHFTPEEFLAMVNLDPAPVRHTTHPDNLVSAYADELNIESLEQLVAGSFEDTLIRKLRALTPTENTALVDVLEQLWRVMEGSLAQALEDIGIRLADAHRD